MRRVLTIVLVVAAAIATAPAAGRAEPDRGDTHRASRPASARGSITARATVIATGPGRAALAAGDSLLAGAESGVVLTGDGVARVTRLARPAPGAPVLLVEFVAN